MANAKVVLNGTTLIDLTQDTVTANGMLYGLIAHKNDGTTATGTIETKTSSNLSASGKTVTVPSGYYAQQYTKDVDSGTITNNTTLPSGSSSSGTLNSGSYIKIGAGYHNEAYYLGGGSSPTGTLTIDDSSNARTNIDVSNYQYVNLIGINVPTESSFYVTVPNGSSNTITFIFEVDENGNTTVSEAVE